MGVPVYSTRFGVWQHQTGGVNVLNDTGELWVVRQVTAYNGNNLEVVTFAFIDYNTSAGIFVQNTSLAPGTWWAEWQGRFVIQPSSEGSDQGFGWTTNGFPIDVYVGGYTLSLP